jgi:UDP-N-acetylglucosamine 4-epimerase
MKILAITNMYPSPAFPGRGVFVQEQIKGLRAIGLNVRVLVIDRQQHGPLAYYRMHDVVRREIAAFGPDLIHVMYGGVMADQVVRRHHHCPVVITFHGSDLLGENLSGWLRKIISHHGVHCSRRAAQQAEGIIIVARHLMGPLQGAAKPQQIRVIPCGIDLDRFKPMDSMTCKVKIGWDPQAFHVVFASSNADPVKRPWLAQAAVRQARGFVRRIELHYLTGVPNAEVPTWLNAGDVLLLTSLHEGSPTVVKEALACGLPVVSVDVGDVAERIEGIEGCHLSRPSATDLATKLALVRRRGGRIECRNKLDELRIVNVARKLDTFYSETVHEHRAVHAASSIEPRLFQRTQSQSVKARSMRKPTRWQLLQQQLADAPRCWVVTGPAGFIGSNLLEQLLKLDQRVIGLDNFSTGKQSNLDEVQSLVTADQWSRFEMIRGDIADAAVCRRVCAGADIVLHQAALGSVPHSMADPLSSHASNVTGFINLIMAARDAGVQRFVYASSCAVYGDSPTSPKREEMMGKPLSPYAATKMVDELYATAFACAYGFGSIGLRYFNVFGPRQDPEGAYAAVIPKWIDALIRRQTVTVNGDGETTRDFCYIDNVVQANLLAATVARDGGLHQIYNVALGQRITLNELFSAIKQELAKRDPSMAENQPRYVDFRPGDIRHSMADITKARRLLGFEPALDLKAGLARALDWYLAHTSTASAPSVIGGKVINPTSARSPVPV